MFRPTKDDRGMATAEYTVGTLGAVCFGLVLYKLGVLDHDNPWVSLMHNVLESALGWRPLGDFIPGRGLM